MWPDWIGAVLEALLDASVRAALVAVLIAMKSLDADPYARDVSRRVAGTDDAAMLAAAGSTPAFRSGNDAARRELGIQYLRRGLQLDPSTSMLDVCCSRRRNTIEAGRARRRSR